MHNRGIAVKFCAPRRPREGLTASTPERGAAAPQMRIGRGGQVAELSLFLIERNSIAIVYFYS